MPDDRKHVREYFARIARRYDLVNSLCSFGIERRWRQAAVAALELKKETRLLDLCAGTMTVSADAARAAAGVRVIAVDFCREMLCAGIRRSRNGVLRQIEPVCGTGENLPLRDGVFDGAIMTYGIRNLTDPAKGLAEIHRVLKPSGRLVILEFTRPDHALFRPIYGFYLGRIMPLFGSVLAGSWKAYRYLSTSIESFMPPETLLGLLEKAGFRGAAVERLTLGTVGIYSAHKPKAG